MKISDLTYDGCLVELKKEYLPSPEWSLKMHQSPKWTNGHFEVAQDTFITITKINAYGDETRYSISYFGVETEINEIMRYGSEVCADELIEAPEQNQ